MQTVMEWHHSENIFFLKWRYFEVKSIGKNIIRKELMAVLYFCTHTINKNTVTGDLIKTKHYIVMSMNKLPFKLDFSMFTDMNTTTVHHSYKSRPLLCRALKIDVMK